MVIGMNIFPRATVWCHFGQYQSYGYFDANHNSVVCISPSAASISRQTLFLKLGADHEWLNSGMDFHFHEPIFVENVTPREIIHGLKFFYIKGSGFFTTPPLLCCFGEGRSTIKTVAALISNTTIKSAQCRQMFLKRMGATYPFL